MENFGHFFATVTPAQAELVASAMGMLSVLLAAVLAPLVFHLVTRRGVADFKAAIADVTASASVVREKTDAMSGEIALLGNKLVEINELLSAVQMNIALVQSKSDEETQEIEARVDGAPRQNEDERQRLKGAWSLIRDKVENLASDPSISGHARARYARIDRRDYRELVRTLDRDGRLGSDLAKWERAIEIWYVYRPNNQSIPIGVLSEIEGLASELARAVYVQPDRELSLADRVNRDACQGKLPHPLTSSVIQERYFDYAPGTTQTVLANYAEGGYFASKGQPPRFRKIGEGEYEAICSDPPLARPSD